MKLMMVIVQDQDYAKLATRLIQNRIRATKFETSGLYSNKKNVTLFICVEEEQQIISAIESNTSIEILCIVENGTRQEAVMKEQVEAFYDAVQQQYENAAAGNGPEQFYRGTLRSGQVISSESSVTIIGDVNPGAKIISQGNIVILGALKGNAQAGCMGDRNCFIFALDMQPIQIQIGDLIAKSPDKPEPKRRTLRRSKTPEVEAQIAIARDGNIYIEPITKNILNNI